MIGHKKRIKVNELLKELGPVGYGDFNVEPLEDYLARVKELAPQYPDCILKQWFHRHWDCVRSDWAWIGLPWLRFHREFWSTDRIYSNLSYSNKKNVDSWSAQFRNDRRLRESYLGEFMLEHGTWPVPIIIVHNNAGLTMPNGIPLTSPYDLLEGHHRLSYLRAMYEDGHNGLHQEHALWISEPDLKRVSDKWDP